LALVLVVLVGCSFDSPEVQTIENSCANDASCPAGSCDGNICVDDTGASVEVAIEVLRGATDMPRVTPASWAFPAEPASGSSVRDLVLPATREVRGVVRWGDLRVPATLRFVRRMTGPVAPLPPVPVEVDTLREVAGDEGQGEYDFSAALVAGETYDVVVLPSSDIVVTPTEATAPAIRSLPPMYSEVVVGNGDPAEPFRFDVRFPIDISQDCSDNIDAGCTLKAEILSIDEEGEVAESGLQVRAIDRQTGRVVSSIGETDELGHFAIRIGVDVADYLIRATSSVGRDPFPAVSVDPEVAFANDPIKKRIYIPRLSPFSSLVAFAMRTTARCRAQRYGSCRRESLVRISLDSMDRSADRLPRTRKARSARSFSQATIRSLSPRPKTWRIAGASFLRKRWSAKKSRRPRR
jgi:hypothetical protein